MRRVAWGLVGLVAVLGALLAAVALMATTATGFRWLAESATALSGGRLELAGVSGHLAAPVRIERVVFATEARRIELDGLRLEWQPRALRQRRLEIDLLAAQAVRVAILKPDPTPARLPTTLRLLVDVVVQVVDAAQFDLTTAGQTLRFRQVRARLDGRGDRYRLTRASATTPWAAVSGSLELGKEAPFALEGRFEAARRDPLPLQAGVRLAGTLAAILFDADASAEDMGLIARGEATPFAAVRLPRLLVAGQGVDPRRFAKDAPAADLAFSGVFEGRPDERVVGTFSLGNALAGRLDQGRLPLANLTGAVVGDASRADFSALVVDLGAAGRMTGDGQWRDGQVTLTLGSPRLDLAGLHRELYPTRLQVSLELTGDAARQMLTGTLAETWGQGRFILSHDGVALRLQALDFQGGAGRLAATGALRLDAGRAFVATFDATRINPARFGNFPRARLNLAGEVSGTLTPELRLQTRFTLPVGELEGSPVRGQGRLQIAGRRLADADVDVDLAGNRAKVKGAYGHAGDRLHWDVDAPALARLRFGLGGRLKSTGNISGDPAQPRIEAQLTASGLRLPGDVAADAVELELELQASASGTFDGQLDARGVRFAGQRLDALAAQLRGRRDAHTLALDARLPEWRVNAALAGGLGADDIWRGQLREATVLGEWPMQLTAPAALVLGRDQQQVDALVLAVAGGRLRVDHFSRRGTRLASRGEFEQLPFAPVLELLEQARPFTTDLRLAGAWNLRLGEALDGTLRLQRQSGDVRLKDPALDLGLTTLALEADAVGSGVGARLTVVTAQAGRLRADGHATLARDGAGLVLPRSAPLVWNATVDVPDLRLFRPLLPVGVRADARLDASLSGSGSLASPRIDGRVDASRIRFDMPEAGVAITDGTLRLVLDGDRVRVQQGELKGSSGRIGVSGEAQLRNPQAGLTLDFEKFAAVQRSDRRVVVSGTARLALDPGRLQLTGELAADRARLEMPEASRPQLADDVVIAGRPPRARPVAQRLPLALDLQLRLGDDFLFKGAGLDVRLGGRLRVFTVDRTVRGEGVIQVEEGRYAAYGQTLTIERGVMRFVGPIDNPGLDVLAVRATPTVKAGVQVGGTVRRPLVKLYSDPPLPDAEKLSWLVLGHGLEDSGQEEFALMQLAAGALLSQAESVNLQATLAETLGIDSFDVRAGGGDDLAGTVVSIGKRLSSRATLSYAQSLDGLSQVVKVLYQWSPRVRLEAQAGQQSSFDVFYTREYD